MGNLLSLNWYGFLIGGAMVLCIGLAWFLLKMRGYNSDIVFDVAIICIPLAIVGARIYYILFDIIGGNGTFSDWFSNLKFLGFSKESGSLKFDGLSGLAIFGGLIFATLGGLIVAKMGKRKKPKDRMSFMQLLDMFYILIILGQAIGRWGNYANQEAYGGKITNPSFQFFPIAVFIAKEGAYFQATFFYEFFFNTIGFLVLLWLYFGKRRSYDGFNFSVYCIWYGAVRATIEGMRSDSLMMGPFRVSQLLAAALVIYGIANIAFHVYKAKKCGKKPFIFIDKSSLSLDYFGYEKTIMYCLEQKNTAQDLPPQDEIATTTQELEDKNTNAQDENERQSQ